jgi:fumarate hydratase class II
MSDEPTRTERDSLGEVEVPADALYGAQTQRAVENFPVSGTIMPLPFIRALAMIKGAAAEVNRDLGLLDGAVAEAIFAAAAEVEEGRHDGQFPVDVFQTGSGTSSNMNANEVIGRIASDRLEEQVHPNDQVNMGQSSNDVIPTAIHVSACLEIHQRLLPALDHLAETIEARAVELSRVVKTGRTHLMDALPLTMGQELGGWAAQVREAIERIESALVRLRRLALGGTAVGTGLNAHPRFADAVAALLSSKTGIDFETAGDRFAAMGGQDAAVEMSGQLRGLAVSLIKIANDLRWMNSGPLAGLGEIALPALQPGSSIMPGKVNAVIPESAAMACVQVMGNDAAVAIAGQSGSFQLNVMLPLIARNLLESIALLSSSARLLADRAIAGFTVNRERLGEVLARNPILVTALNPVIGYEKAAAIARRAYGEGRPVLEVALEMTDFPEKELKQLLDPEKLTGSDSRE